MPGFGPVSVVGWCGSRAGTLSLEEPLRLIACSLEEARRNRPAMCIVESESVAGLAELRMAYEQLGVPVLLLVKPSEVDTVLPWVRSSDDVCLETAPEALIRFRLLRLLKTFGPARDQLTGLSTRKDFQKALEAACAEVSRQQPVSLILLDLDHFKLANDRYGHLAGDEILKECGRVIGELCGDEVLAGRFGGEEFSVLLRAHEDSAHRYAETLRWAIHNADYPQDISVTCSLGVATTFEPASQEQIFRQADEALYAAKAQGRNQTVSFRDLEEASRKSGDDVKLAGLQNRARVLVERVANLITLKSKRIVEDVQAEAETDALTQFYTRKSFDRRLSSEFAEGSGDGPLTMALVDVDHFGLINKQFGWPTGDKILRDVSKLIKDNVRNTDWIGRYGGEEFCIVMPRTTLDDARDVLERLRALVAKTEFTATKGEPVHITLSIGATVRTAEENPAELIEKASQLTLQSKKLGRNRLMIEA